MNKLRQAGFSAVEAVIAIVIVAALVGVGVWVMSRQPADKTDTSEVVDLQENTEAPAVDAASDLDAAEQALDASNIDAGSSDSEALTEQINAF